MQEISEIEDNWNQEIVPRVTNVNEEWMDSPKKQIPAPNTTSKTSKFFKISICSKPEFKISTNIPTHPIPAEHLRDYILVNAINANASVLKQSSKYSEKAILSREHKISKIVAAYSNSEVPF